MFRREESRRGLLGFGRVAGYCSSWRKIIVVVCMGFLGRVYICLNRSIEGRGGRKGGREEERK